MRKLSRLPNPFCQNLILTNSYHLHPAPARDHAFIIYSRAAAFTRAGERRKHNGLAHDIEQVGRCRSSTLKLLRVDIAAMPRNDARSGPSYQRSPGIDPRSPELKILPVVVVGFVDGCPIAIRRVFGFCIVAAPERIE